MTAEFQTMFNSDGDSNNDMSSDDYTISLYEAVQNHINGMWLKPPHQRDFVWDNGKTVAWIERLAIKNRRPIGVIVTYQLTSIHNSPTYINDGYQRISATMRFLDAPQLYGYDVEKARRIVTNYRIPIQHRLYSSQDAALEDFQLLNIGTALTNFELFKGVVTLMPGYDMQWRPMIERVQERIAGQSQRVCRIAKRREDRDRMKRNNYTLITKWITRDTSLSEIGDNGTKTVPTAEIKSRTAIEYKLREALELHGVQKSADACANLESFIDRETGNIEAVWLRVREVQSRAITETLYRWIMLCAIWRRNNDIPMPKWQDFLEKLLQRTQGASVIPDENASSGNITIKLQGLGRLKTVCDSIGSDLWTGRPTRTTPNIKLMPGYEHSHIQPFNEFGNGPTVPEHANANRSRGAKPIE